MIKLMNVEGHFYWVKAESVLFIQEKELGSGILIDQLPELIDVMETGEEVADRVEIALGRSTEHTVYTVAPSAGYANKSMWATPTIIATEIQVDQVANVKRHAKQGESIVITGTASRHDLDIGAVVITAFDADADGQVIAAGQFVGYEDYDVLEGIPKLETIIVENEDEDEPEVIEAPYQLVHRAAKANETIEIIGNSGSNKVKIGARMMAIADAMPDKMVIAAGQFIPFDDYSVVEFI
jgi:hypothetical protein